MPLDIGQDAPDFSAWFLFQGDIEDGQLKLFYRSVTSLFETVIINQGGNVVRIRILVSDVPGEPLYRDIPSPCLPGLVFKVDG